MLLNFNHEELKSYLKKITGYEVKSVWSIENDPQWYDTTFNLHTKEIKIAAFCDAKNTPGFSKFTMTEFLWNQEIKVDYIKYMNYYDTKDVVVSGT